MADYTEQQLIGALRKADAAGDTEAARAIAKRLQAMRQPKAPKVELEPMSVSPTEGMSGLERFRAGVGKSFADTASGLKQAATDSAARSATMGSVALNRLGLGGLAQGFAENVAEPLRQYSGQVREDVAEQRRIDEPLMDTGAGFAGSVGGTLAQLIGPGVALRGTTAGALALPRTVAGNSAQGAALGSVQPVVSEDERVGNTVMGAAGGAVGAAVPKAVGAVARPVRGALAALLGRPTASGVERKAAETIVRESGDLARLLQANPSAVPGVQRTLAEETLDPGVARLERQLRGQSSAFDPIDRANAAARVSALEGIAGTDAEMAAAEAARSTASRQAREQAMGAGPVDIAQTVRTLDEAIAGQEGRPAVQNALREVRSLLVREGDSPETRVAVLDNVRKTIGDMLDGKYGGDTARALAGSRELIGIRDALNDDIARQVPAFGDYLNAYREGSVPINRMQIGRELLDRGAGGATPDPITGVRPLTPAAFSRQANDLDSLAARATGFGKARADQILRPEDIATIKAIQDDLSRQQFRATAGSGGNSMTQERQELARRMGRSAVRAIPVVGSFAESLEAMGEQRLNQTLARLLANPVEARRVLQSLNEQDRRVVAQALAQLSASTGAATPALAE